MPRDGISRVDWSRLEHLYGPAADVPELWVRLLSEGDEDFEIGNVFCHQGTVSPATHALTPFVIELAQSDHPSQLYALRLLTQMLRSTGGPLELKDIRANAMAGRSIRNPATGEVRTVPSRAPNQAALREERACVADMKSQIESALPVWLALQGHHDWRIRAEALAVIASIRHHPDKPDTEVLAAEAMGAAKAEDERAAFREILASIRDDD